MDAEKEILAEKEEQAKELAAAKKAAGERQRAEEEASIKRRMTSALNELMGKGVRKGWNRWLEATLQRGRMQVAARALRGCAWRAGRGPRAACPTCRSTAGWRAVGPPGSISAGAFWASLARS